jgi:phytoene/squalene synthetase
MPGQIDLYHGLSGEFSRRITEKYSTSFSLAIRLLSPRIRQDIYNIYGFVRLADEIVDTFHDFPKEELFDRFETDVHLALQQGISVNPVLNSFQRTARRYNIHTSLVEDFLKSMRSDLHKQTYSPGELREYIYGSADVVGLMCLKVFVDGDEMSYLRLKPAAMRLGSAFQKVNFLRDLRDDMQELGRTYFPGMQHLKVTRREKERIIAEVRQDFKEAREGIRGLPSCAKLGVMTAYRYYLKLLSRLESMSPEDLKARRARVPDFIKIMIIVTTYLMYKFSLTRQSW